jgi:DNA polymerase III epsilon subunit-like protein
MMKLYFFDTETTGTEDDARIIQYAAKRLTDDCIFTGLFDPEQKIEIGAMATHHITPEMLKGKPKFSTMVKILDGIFDDHIAVAHNAVFDVSRLEYEGVKKPRFIIDTLKLARNLLQWSDTEPEKYNLQYLRYFLELEKTEHFLERYTETKITAHDATGDVIILETLFMELFKRYKEKTNAQDNRLLVDMINLSAKPVFLRRMPFGKHRGEEISNVPDSYLDWLKKQIQKNREDFSDEVIFTLKGELLRRDNITPKT